MSSAGIRCRRFMARGMAIGLTDKPGSLLSVEATHTLRFVP